MNTHHLPSLEKGLPAFKMILGKLQALQAVGLSPLQRLSSEADTEGQVYGDTAYGKGPSHWPLFPKTKFRTTHKDQGAACLTPILSLGSDGSSCLGVKEFSLNGRSESRAVSLVSSEHPHSTPHPWHPQLYTFSRPYPSAPPVASHIWTPLGKAPASPRTPLLPSGAIRERDMKSLTQEALTKMTKDGRLQWAAPRSQAHLPNW